MALLTNVNTRKAKIAGGALLALSVAGGAALYLLTFDSPALTQTLQQEGKGQQAQAAAPDQTRPPPIWVVNCTDNKGRLDCQAGQAIFLKTTGRRVLSVAVRVPADTKKPVMLLQVPLGVYL